MTPSQFPARFGKYILLDRLNAGGMAEVFRAKVTGVEGFERLVAIKCMLPQLVFDEQFIGMFIDEARLAAQLSHANVVQIYELGRQAERLYIAMELVNGRDLRHILRTAKASDTQIPASFAAYVIAKAAEGLDFAHRKVGVDGSPLGLVHRDVSPQNILVTYDGEVKVVDFGIAKASAQARSTETQAGVLKGKFAYMAPEQVAGEETDRRADIFSLGAVLFEVITGERLFYGDNDLAVLEKVRDVVIPNFDVALPLQALGLADVLRHALAKKPAERFSYASEMAEGLEEHLIEDRSIFGAKRAAQVMRALYADEVAELANTLKRYAEVTVDNCVATIGEAEAPRDHGGPERTVYESAFDDKTGEVPMQGVINLAPTPAPRPVHKAAPPQAARVTLSKNTQMRPSRELAPRRAQRVAPETGVGTRPRAMRPDKPQARPNANLTPSKPMNLELDTEDNTAGGLYGGGAARVLRQLTRLALLAMVITGGLVLLVRYNTSAGDKAGVAAQLSRLSAMRIPWERIEALRPLIAETLLGRPPDAAGNQGPPVVSHAPDNKAIDPPLSGPGRSYVSLKFRGVSGARVFLDGKDFGTTAHPLDLRLSMGTHVLKVIEPGANGRAKTVEFKLGPQHTQKAPLQKTISVSWGEAGGE